MRTVTWRGETFRIRRDSIEIAGVRYSLPAYPDEPGRFFLDRGATAIRSGRPQLIASSKYPLLLTVDRVAVQAYPGFIPRGKGAKTYVNPKTGDRVATTKGPMWIFRSARRPASACGTTDPEQTLADVVDLAKIWLRSPEPR